MIKCPTWLAILGAPRFTPYLQSPLFVRAEAQNQKDSILHRSVRIHPAQPVNVQASPVKGPVRSPMFVPRSPKQDPHSYCCSSVRAVPQQVPNVPTPSTAFLATKICGRPSNAAICRNTSPKCVYHRATLSMQLSFPRSSPTPASASTTASVSTSHVSSN